MTNLLPIVVAYDGSAQAGQALAWAAEEAVGTGAPVRVVTIDEVAASQWGADVSVHDPDLLVRAEKSLEDAGVRDFSVERHSGHVVGELLQMADGAAMLVAGSRGHSRMGEVFVGSVSQHLARHATCSVIVVRDPHITGLRRVVVGVDGAGHVFNFRDEGKATVAWEATVAFLERHLASAGAPGT